MKKQLCNLLLLLAIAQMAIAQNNNDRNKYEKRKSYSKSYNISSGDKISLFNQFGEMNLNTWDKNEVKVDVEIIAKSSEEDWAQEIIDRISIEDNKGSRGVSFKTKFADQNRSKNNEKNHRNEEMQINYTVYLPAGNPLHAENQFGSMSVPDYRGEAELVSKFGSLETGRISNARSINVEFGKADIGQVDGGKVTIKFSQGTIAKLTGDVNANFEFCDKIKVSLDNEAKDVELRNSYSTVYLDLNRNFSAKYDITTSFGELSNKSDFTINREGDDENFSSNYRYTGSSGNGNTRMKVRSEFGKVILGHNLQVDMQESKKQKGVRS
jgi:hypothetical protein